MKYKIRRISELGLVGLFAASLCVAMFVSVSRPQKAHAFQIDTGMLTEPGVGKLGDTITAKFISKDLVTITVGLDEPIFKDTTKSLLTYKDGYSGDYKLIKGANSFLKGTGCGGDSPSCGVYELQNRKTISGGSSPNTIAGYLIVKGDLGKKLSGENKNITVEAARKEAQSHGNISLVFGIYYNDSGTINTDDRFRYGDVQDDGHDYWSDDSNGGFANLNAGAYAEKGFVTTPSNIDGALIEGIFNGGSITYNNQAYSYCEAPASATTPIKKYFQANNCSGGGDIIFDASWQSLTQAQILAKFVGTGTLSVQVGKDGDSKTIIVAQDTNAANQPSTSGGGTVEESNCETSGFGLSWITCPIINGLSGVTGGVFTHIIEPYLKTTPIDTTADANNSIFKAWSGIRNIANIVLIFALLFVVFGQAIGGGLIDAYTAKKIMPRLLAAAVLINISIYIVAILIDIFNVLGSGIGNLVLGPFKDTIFRHFNPDKGGGKGIAIGLIIAAIIGIILAKVTDGVFKHGSNGSIGVGSAVMPFIHFLLVFVLIPGVLISLAIFATLIIRQGLILILVVTAPLAFAFFALPSTEKYFKKWWETLSATLMVYPIMTVIFSASIIMASLAYNVGDNIDVPLSGFIGAIVAFIILIVPLVLIPFSFKLAGGLLGNVMNVTKGLGSKGGGFGKNRYKEQKGLERKSLFEQKWNNNEVGARTRYNAKRAGREPYWSEKRDQVAGIGSGRTASRVRGGFSRLTHGSTPSPEAVAAGAAAAAVAGGGPASGLARVAAIDAYSSAVGTHGAAAASASAAAAGVAAGRGSNRTVASNVGAAAAAAHVAAAASGTVTAQAANAAAYSAGEAIEMGRPPEAARSAGAAAGASYDRFTTTHGLSGPEATVASGVVGQAAAGIHATEALRSGNHVTAGAEAATGAVVAENAYAGALNSRHEGPAAAHTAAIASGEAFIDLKASIGGGTTRLTNAEVNRAATAASGAHVAAATGGANETVARQQGIFAGRAVR